MMLRMKQFILGLVLVAMQYAVNSGDMLQPIAEQYCQGDDHARSRSFAKGSGS